MFVEAEYCLSATVHIHIQHSGTQEHCENQVVDENGIYEKRLNGFKKKFPMSLVHRLMTKRMPSGYSRSCAMAVAVPRVGSVEKKYK